MVLASDQDASGTHALRGVPDTSNGEKTLGVGQGLALGIT